MPIKQIIVSGFKSIERAELMDSDSYTVFAGPNGAGKSNLFDAIHFASKVVSDGAISALRRFGGYEHIHCYKKRKEAARTFTFEVEIELGGKTWRYSLKVHNMDKNPCLAERLEEDGEPVLLRESGKLPVMPKQGKSIHVPDYPTERSALFFYFHTPFFQWIMNIEVYRFDPLGAKEPNASKTDGSKLDGLGHNVATMLKGFAKNQDINDTIMEWMEMIVPGLEKVSTTRQRLDGRTVMTFREEGTAAQFPANLISDGTIFVLCILTAILSRNQNMGMTLIEEPERGINPKAIAQITKLFRENATNEHPVWVTTHNETVVRECDPRELIFVNKCQGKTQYIHARDSIDIIGQMPLDKAWLSNLFSGGLPW